MKTIKKNLILGIIGKKLSPEKKGKKNVIKKIIQKLERKNYQLRIDQYIAEITNKKHFWTKEEILEKSDIVMTLGGDGTVIKAARSVTKKSPKILAVNLGNIGFLTEIRAADLEKALKKIEEEQYETDRRALLKVTIYRNKKEIFKDLALNEIVVNQGPFARLITMTIKINQQKALTFRADGLIVATPTGSTGHSLSAGGPVVHPEIDGFIINPLCPILLSLRPMVVPGNSTIFVRIEQQQSEKTQVRITFDAQESFLLEHGDQIEIRRAEHHIDFIRVTSRHHYQNVEEKLRWREK